MDSLRIGIIGAGRIGKVHAHTLRSTPGVEIAAVSDIVPESATALAASHAIPKSTDDYREIIADPGIDAVFVCSSTDTHATIIEQAANAGKHIFCEKPLALDLDDIDQALAAVDRNGVLLLVAFNRRYDAGYRKMREDIRSGAVGRPELCRLSTRDPAPPPIGYIKVSGGLFLDMMIHDFDLSRFLLDDEPEEVFAWGDCLGDPAIGEAGDVDTAVVTVRFRRGTLCQIANSRRAAYGHDQRAEVHGSGGMVLSENLLENNIVTANAAGFHSAPVLNFFMERYMPAYREEARVFVDCVLNRKPPPPGAADGRASVVMG
ncbi:MAG: inositol 2-dehydrogenase, partial [Planctomycetaceae bacterium]|nr:inositol 2-dehydrogenase [Planctomycetaceae bacterium]